MDPYEMDPSQLASELGMDDVPDVSHKTSDHEEQKATHQTDEPKKARNEGRKAPWKAQLIATELSVEEEEEKYEEFLKKEHTQAVASVNDEGTEIRIVSFDREGKEITVVLDNSFGEDNALLANLTDDLKCRRAILILEKQELIKLAQHLIVEAHTISELREVNTDADGFRRRSILAEMFAFQLGLRSRRWDIKNKALDEDIENPKPKKERVKVDGKGKTGAKLGKYDVLEGKGRKGKEGKTDRFGKFDAGRVTKKVDRKGKKDGRPRNERKPKRDAGPAAGGEVVEY